MSENRDNKVLVGLILGALASFGLARFLHPLVIVTLVGLILGALYVGGAFGPLVEINHCRFLPIFLTFNIPNLVAILLYFTSILNTPPGVEVYRTAPPIGSFIFGMISTILLGNALRICRMKR